MKVEYPDSTLMIDFVIPTKDEALAYIADGAINGRELLEDAGLTAAEAEAELKRLGVPSKADPELTDALYSPDGPFGSGRARIEHVLEHGRVKNMRPRTGRPGEFRADVEPPVDDVAEGETGANTGAHPDETAL
jgi:hypothetical protein